jgi:glucosamine--fructose-6-phosphate aminotransferase (isomerizing)
MVDYDAPQYEQTPGRPFAEAVSRQPAVLRDTLPALRRRIESDELLGAPASAAFVGIGASHAAAQAAVHTLTRSGFRAARFTGAELPDDGTPLADLYVGISQSGRSPEPLEALRRVDGASRIAVVNEPGSPLAGIGHPIELGGLPDSGVSTIAYSATAAALSMLAERWLGGVDSRWDEVGSLLEEAIAAHDDLLDGWVERLSRCTTIDIVGGGVFAGVAEAAALVFREAVHVAASASETRTYLHGQMDSAGARSGHILLGGRRESILKRQLGQRTSNTMLIGTAADDDGELLVDTGNPAIDAVVATGVLHELALRWSTAAGVDPDAAVFERLDTKVAG